MDINNMVLVDRNLLAQVVNSLKTLDVRGWNSIDTLVGCVQVLSQAANQPPVKVNVEEPEGGETPDENKDEDRDGV